MKKTLAGLLLVLISVVPASAQKSKSALQTEINTAWPDNNSGQITPKALRGPPQDMVNSYLDLNGASSFACSPGQVISGFSTLSTPVCVSSGGTTSLTTAHIFVGNNSNVPTDVALSGDCSMVVSGAITCTKSNGVAFSASATGGLLIASQFPALTGDITTTAGALATTLATVNPNVGSFGSAANSATFTVNAKGLITAASQTAVTPAIANVTGLGTGVATALGTAANGVGGFVTSPVANANLATMAANTFKANGTAGTAAPTDIACSTGGVVGRNASANLNCQLILDNNIFSGAAITTSKINFGTGVATASANALNATGGLVGFSGAFGTPTQLTLTNATGLVASTGTTATGTPSSSTFLRGDNTWSTPAGGGTVTSIATAGLATGGTITGSGTITVTAASKSDQQTGTSSVVAVTPSQAQSHDSAAKAWAYCSQAAGTYTLQASYNISGGTCGKTATGDLTLSMTTAFSSAQYSCVASSNDLAARAVAVQTVSASSFRINIYSIGTTPALTDGYFSVHCFGRQ